MGPFFERFRSGWKQDSLVGSMFCCRLYFTGTSASPPPTNSLGDDGVGLEPLAPARVGWTQTSWAMSCRMWPWPTGQDEQCCVVIGFPPGEGSCTGRSSLRSVKAVGVMQRPSFSDGQTIGLLYCVAEQFENTSPHRSLVDIHRLICKRIWGAAFRHTKNSPHCLSWVRECG